MNKIKVLQVVGQLTIGGQEIMVMNLCKNIDKGLVAFDFLVYGDKIGELEREANEFGWNVIHIPYLQELGLIKFIKKIEKEIQKNGPYDAIHCHTSFNSGLIVRTAKKMNIPLRIIHSHTTSSGKKASMAFSLYARTMRRLIIENGNNYLACGSAAGNYLFGEKIFGDKGVIIKNGIDTLKFSYNASVRAEIRKELDIEDKYVVGHVGRFSVEKNHVFLLDVFYNVCKSEKDAVLLLVGDGPLKNTIEHKAELMGINDKIIFAGRRHDIHNLLQVMDIFVFPSHYEGLPVSVVEAQASGLKCLVSDNVTSEIKVTNLVEFISLRESLSTWSNSIIENKFSIRSLNNDFDNEYDISVSCNKLYDIYKKGVANEVDHN